MSSGDRSVRANRGRLLAVEPFQRPDDFLGRELAATLPLIQISVSDDIVHGKDSLRYAFLVHDGKPAHLFVRHALQGFVDFVLRFAGDYVRCGDLSDRKLSRQAVSSSRSDADVAVRDNSFELSAVP